MMRKLVIIAFVLGSWVFLPAAVTAQEVGDWELFGGFSYLRAETSPELDPLGVGHINSFGWQASITEYPYHWFGATADFSGVYAQPTITIPANYFGPANPPTDTSISNALNSSAFTMMFGPSFAYRRNPGVIPFAHVLLGGMNGRLSLTSKGEMIAGPVASTSEWVFAYAFGGGVDFRLSKKLVALRTQADWIRSHFPDGGDDRQNNIRASIGLVFRIKS